MSPDQPARYRRRRRWPILVILVVLLSGAGVVWFQLLKPVAAASTRCNQPGPAPAVTGRTSGTSGTSATSGLLPIGPGRPGSASGGRTTGVRAGNSGASVRATAATAGSSTSASTLSVTTTLGAFTDAGQVAAVRPANPSTIVVQVFNASLARGLAKTVTDDLRAAGFADILGGRNDPLYPAFDLVCGSEIRFGPAGNSAARTMLVVQPCAQLVMDNRIDDSVDLALGARYSYAPLSAAVKSQLRAISVAALPPAVIEGQTAAPRPPASIAPAGQGGCSL